MYFFLKERNSDKATLIYLIYYLKNEGKNFKYSTGQKVHPDDWNFGDRIPKSKRGAGGVISKHISSVLSKFSDHLGDMIKECGKWFEKQHVTYKNFFKNRKGNIMSNPKRRAKLEELCNLIKYNLYKDSQEKIWYDNIDKVLDYYNKNKKTPSAKILLGRWFASQKALYKNFINGKKGHAIRCPKRRSKLEELCKIGGIDLEKFCNPKKEETNKHKCICGSLMRNESSSITRHNKSKKHKDYLAKN